MKKFIIIIVMFAVFTIISCKQPPTDFKTLKDEYVHAQLSQSSEFVSQLGLPKEMAVKYNEGKPVLSSLLLDGRKYTAIQSENEIRIFRNDINENFKEYKYNVFFEDFLKWDKK